MEAPINTNEINEPFLALERDLGLSAFKELLDLFKKTFPAKLEKIARAIEDKDHDQVFFETHQMVSSAANMGATDISGLIREFETALKASEIQRAKDLLANIRDRFNAYIQNADNYLSSGSHTPPELPV